MILGAYKTRLQVPNVGNKRNVSLIKGLTCGHIEYYVDIHWRIARRCYLLPVSSYVKLHVPRVVYSAPFTIAGSIEQLHKSYKTFHPVIAI